MLEAHLSGRARFLAEDLQCSLLMDDYFHAGGIPAFSPLEAAPQVREEVLKAAFTGMSWEMSAVFACPVLSVTRFDLFSSPDL